MYYFHSGSRNKLRNMLISDLQVYDIYYIDIVIYKDT